MAAIPHIPAQVAAQRRLLASPPARSRPAPGARAGAEPDVRDLARTVRSLSDWLAATQRSRVRWKRGFFAAAVAAVLAGGLAWAAVGTTVNSYSAIFGETYDFNATLFSAVGAGMLVNAISTAAAGNSNGTAVEMAVVLAGANTALGVGDWYYSATVQEAGVATVTANNYKVELFQDGTSKGALYMKQATSDAVSVEGVTFKWSLGTSLASNAAYTIRVTQV